MSHRMWGTIEHRITVMRGIAVLHCSSRNGIRISSNAMRKTPLLQTLNSYPGIEQFWDGDAYYFEQGYDDALLYAALPTAAIQTFFTQSLTEDMLQQVMTSAYRFLIQHYPDFYTHATGKGLDIFESEALLKQHFQHHPAPYRFIHVARSDQWNIPKGYVYISVKDAHDQEQNQGYLITRAQYEEIWTSKNRRFPLPLNQFQPFSLNRNLPYVRVEDPKPNAYYYCTHVIDGGRRMITGYNYQRKAFKKFLTTAADLKRLTREEGNGFCLEFADESHRNLRPEHAAFATVLEYACNA